MGIAPATLVVGAARQPLPYGLFSVFPMRPAGDRWESGVQWETGTCDPVDGIGAVGCGDPQTQVARITGSPNTGTWTLSDGVRGDSDPLAILATVDDVQDAVDGLLGEGVAVVSGSTGGPWTITWVQVGPAGTSLTLGPDTFDQGLIGLVYTPGTEEQSAVGLPKNLRTNTGTVGAASEFTVYGHFQCSPVGWTQGAAQDMATGHLLGREESRVEQAFWTADLGNTPTLRGSTVLTGFGALPMISGLALLEDWIATHYGSLGVLHMTRGAATLLTADDVITTTGGRLTTKLGTPVVAGSGYDGSSPLGAPPAAGTTWMYVTPALFGYRSEIFTSSNRPGDLFDRAQNDLYAVAERSYLLGFDPCGTAAVEVLLPYDDSQNPA